VLAASVTGAGLLHTAADLVESGDGETDHMEMVDHQPGAGQAPGDRGGSWPHASAVD
jgi:hypothetical protein